MTGTLFPDPPRAVYRPGHDTQEAGAEAVSGKKADRQTQTVIRFLEGAKRPLCQREIATLMMEEPPVICRVCNYLENAGQVEVSRAKSRMTGVLVKHYWIGD